jgi:uncharacterized repeat protein (TIGR01451 family)/fimbrial isopeptide formation D2 family protein
MKAHPRRSPRLAVPSLATVLAVLLPAFSAAHPFPPTWGPPNEPSGPVHFAPVAWPNEPANPADCGLTCGEWQPYSRFQNSLNDPRVRDPSNGGTSPQNYVNVASSCIDTRFPSIYYKLHRGAATDGSQDVILFRWRVEQIANTYATGPNPGNFGATDPWNSALWTVFFDIDGDGFRDLAAHLNGASGSPSAPVDMISGIWGNVPTQSLDYLNDPNIKLIAHNPTAFVQGGTILNFQNSLNPTTNWGSAPRSVWDYGTTRSRLVSTNACNEYFIDYQIPTRMLDASPTGPNPALNGPKITRSTPISMLFCTANSLNNPTQKDCAINNRYTSSTPVPGPFGDYLSFDQDDPYSQPIISSVTATAPNTCPGSYQLSARVQDTLAVDGSGNVVSSVKAVDFYYWRDANNNGQADEAGGVWTRITPTATLAPGSRNTWRASWDATNLLRGAYLIGVQAVDDRNRVDLNMSPAPRDNRTFSYVSGNVQGQVYIDGSWASPAIQAAFPVHSPAQSPSASEDWYGNPEVTGQQIAIIDVAINACGLSPSVSKSASPASVATGETVNFSITLNNATGQAISFDRIDDSLPTGFSYQSTASITNDGVPLAATTSPTPGATGSISWTFPSTTVQAGRALVLNFAASAGSTAGSFNNTATALTSLGGFTSPPATVNVDAARISLSKTPNLYSVNPDGSTQVIYTLRYSNDSSVTLTNAVITDPLPAGTTYVSCSGGTSCGFSAPNVSWQLGSLAGGASGTVELRLTVNTNYASTTLLNTASLAVTPPGGGSVSANASSTIRVNVPAPAFTLRKSSPTVQVAPGGNITWTLEYSNYGTGAASSVVLTDTLPDGFSFVSCAVAGSHFAPCSHLNGVVTFNAASIPAGASGSVTLTATAAGSPFPFANPATNNASLTWSGNGTPVTASATVGVTGQACSAVYYLEAGASPTTSLLNATPPPRARAGTNVGLWTSQSAVFTSPVLSSPVPLANRILSVRVFVDSAANRQMTIQVDRVSGGTPTLIASFAQNMPNAPQVFTFSTSAFGAGTAPLAVGEQLRLTFTGNGNTSQRIGLYYDGTQTFGGASTYTDSLTSICSSSSPAALSVAKRVDRANVTSLPAALQYTIDFNNPGGVAATGAQITDTLPPNVSLNSVVLNGVTVTPTPTVTAQQFTVNVNTTGQAAGTLAAGGSGTLVVNATATASASGTLTNTAQLGATGLDPVNSSASTLVGTPGPSSPPALSLSKSVDRSLLSAGDIATYSLTVVNTGGSAATSVVVTDDFPDAAYFSYLDCTAPGGQSCSQSPPGVLSWNVGSLAAGASATLTFRMQVASSGVPAGVTQRDNFATASSAVYCTTPAVSGCTSNTVQVTISGAPRLVLAKSVSPLGPHAAGDVLTYTLNLSNTGSSSAESVRVSDPVPAYTAFVGGISASLGSGSFDAVDNRLLFEIPSLAAGATASLSFQVRVVRPLPQGSTTLTNTATASAANASPVSASVASSAAAQPVLSLDKQGAASLPYPAATLSANASASTTVFVDTAARLNVGDRVLIGGAVRRINSISGRAVSLDGAVSAAQGAPVALGLTYSLLYANTGSADASNVVLSDTLPANLVYAGASVTPSTQPAIGSSGALSFNLGTLAAGASGQLQVYAIPTAAGSYTNAASLSGSSVPTVNDTVTTAVGGLVLDKRTTTPVRTPGSQAEYVLTVRNTGAALISGIAVTDVLPSGFGYASTVHTRINGVDVVPLSSPSAGSGFPAWSSFDLSGGQVLEIRFLALVGANVGPATYDNGLEASAPGAAITPFDPLATSADDVTVLGADQGLVEGVVYTDIDGDGSFDPTVDLPIPGAEVQVRDANGVVYVAIADGEGRFQRVVPAGSTLVSVAESTLPPGLVPTIGADGQNPNSVIVPAGGSARDDNGYVPAGGPVGHIAGRVFDDTVVQDGVQGPGEDGRLGVLVELRDAGTGALIRTTYTDLLGDYSFNNLPPGNYVVRVQPPSGTGLSPPTPNNRALTVVDGGTARADFGLIAAVTVDADLAISKSNGTNGVIAGSSTVYTLVISNAGPSAADGATVFDPAASGLSKTGVSCVASSGGASCPPTPSVAALEAGSLTIPSLPSGGSVSLEVTANVTASAGATVVNTATVSPPDGVTDPSPGNNSDSDSDPVAAPPTPGLGFAKTASLNDTVIANGTADAGETIAYTLTATNTGNVGLTGVSIVDPRLPSLSCTPAQPASLAPSATLVCTGSYTVTQADVDAQTPIANTATADSNETPPRQASANVPVTAAGPQLGFTKAASLNDTVIANGTADAGETIGYTLTATNTGNVGLTGVSIVDPRLPSLSCTPTQPATLAPSATLVCTGSYTVTQADVDAQTPIANTATADSNETPPRQASANVPVTAAGPALGFTKVASLNDTVIANGTADAGETIGYTLTATNTGNVGLTGVTIVDPRLPTLSCTPAQPASLAPSATLVCTGSYTVTQADVDAQQPITNTATADSNETPSRQAAATVPVTVAGPQLGFTKIANLNDSVIANGTADAGETIAYTLTATNAGNISLTGVTIVDPRLPSLSCTPTQPATLAVGAQMICTGSYTVTQADVDAQQPIINTAEANSNETPPRQAAATVPVTAAGPQLGFTKTANLSDTVLANGTADAGETIAYTLTATNSGNVGLTGVSIVDPRLPVLSCTPTQPANLAVGSQMVCTGSYVVTQADVDAQTPITNTATADSNETPPRQASASVPVSPALPMIGLSKRLAAASAQAPYVLDYEFRVRNHGALSLNSVQVLDDLRQTFPAPIGIEVLALTASGNLAANPAYDGVSDTRLLLAAGSSLAVGVESGISLRIRLQPNGASGTFNNVALATATAPNGATTSDDSVDGSNTDPDGNGVPDEMSPTPFQISGLPPQVHPIPVGDPRALLLLLLGMMALAASALRRRA